MTSERPKVVRACGVFHILTSKCASRHNSVHFFWHLNFQKWSGPGVFCTSRHNGVHFSDLATSKSAPNVRCFYLFHWQTCFAPQRHALFRHLNFQKWSGLGAFLYILTSKCASRHNGVQFFISHLPSGLRTRRFSEPTFWPSGATHNWKTQCFATFLPFRAPGSSFFWDFLFFDLLSSSLLFADSSYLCFSSVHIVGSLTSKLPSIICRLQTPHSPMLIILYPPIYLSPEDERKHWLYAAILTLGFQD